MDGSMVKPISCPALRRSGGSSSMPLPAGFAEDGRAKRPPARPLIWRRGQSSTLATDPRRRKNRPDVSGHSSKAQKSFEIFAAISRGRKNENSLGAMRMRTEPRTCAPETEADAALAYAALKALAAPRSSLVGWRCWY